MRWSNKRRLHLDKLLAILAKGQYSDAEDEGDEQVSLNFVIPDNEGGVQSFTAIVALDALQDLGLKNPDGTPVSFEDVYSNYDLDADGNEIDEEGEDA